MFEGESRQRRVPGVICEKISRQPGAIQIDLASGCVKEVYERAGGVTGNFSRYGAVAASFGRIETGDAPSRFLNPRFQKPAPGARQRNCYWQLASLSFGTASTWQRWPANTARFDVWAPP
jgi:hypothetical protein